MLGSLSRHIDRFRGTLRVGRRRDEAAPATTMPPPATHVPGDLGGMPTKEVTNYVNPPQSAESVPPDGESSLLSDYKNLIPGEALAGYVALQAFAAGARNPENVRVVLAIIFCAVAVGLRLIGTQDRVTKRPQYGAVILGALSFVALVYATGGQIFWHARLEDQEYYAQIFATALGILGPPTYSRFASD